MPTAITKFDKPTCRRVGEAMLKALQVEAAKFGLTVEQDGGNYTAADFKPRFRFQPIAPAEGVKTLEQEALELYAKLDGVPAAALNAVLKTREGDQFTLTGYNSRARRFPYMTINVATGERRRAGADFILAACVRSGLTLPKKEG